MVINKKDIEWIKESLDLKANDDSWEKYKDKLKNLLLGEFNINEKDLLESNIGRLIDYIEKIIKEQEKKKIVDSQKKQIWKHQERIHREIILKIEEKEWIEKADKKIIKDEKNLLVVPKERGFHSRSSSLPPKLDLSSMEKDENYDFKKFFVDYYDDEIEKEEKKEEVDEKEIEKQEVKIENTTINTADKEVQTELTMEQLKNALEVIQAQIQILAKK